jgi:small subunit ribosomal protein S15
MLTKENVAEIVKEYGQNEQDTGSTEVQIALLTARIKYLTEHVKVHRNDHHNSRGLLRLVAQRHSLLKYLKRTDYARYTALIAKLGIRG